MPNMGDIVLCPFYTTHKESKKQWQSTITCEKIKNNMGFKMRNMLRFFDIEEQKAFMGMFCSCSYKDCPYCIAIYKKYEDNPDLEPEAEEMEIFELEHKEYEQINMFAIMEEKHENIG